MKKIGLALSGGGIRATVFHLGVLQYLADAGLFGRVASLSSVSGAGLAVGVLFAVSGHKWPTARDFTEKVMPRVREIVLRNSLQAVALRRLVYSPGYWHRRVELLARVLEDRWGIHGDLQQMPTYPFWEINCTTFETGKSFRFRRNYMGDPVVGYVQYPRLPISHMIAASAAFPVLIGPYILKTGDYEWSHDKHGKMHKPTEHDHYTLWDGGVYDNLGLDPLYKIGRGLDDEIDYLIVSNAAGSIGHQARRGHVSISNLKRLLDIAMSQVDSLRSREVYASTILQKRGMYVKIGYTMAEIAQKRGIPLSQLRKDDKEYLTDAQVQQALHYPTTLNAPSEKSFKLLFRHGYETAMACGEGRF